MTRKFQGFSAEGVDEVKSTQQVSTGKKEPKFFSPGLHTVSIESVTDKGPVSSDDTWVTLNLKLSGTGGKSTYTNLLVPTASLLFKGQANSYPAQLLLAFIKSLGYSTDKKVLPSVMSQLFSDEQKLVGKEIQVKIGYTGNHLEAKDGKLALVQKYGRPVLMDGEPAMFSEREAAHQWAEANGLKLQKFAEVVGFEPAEKLVAPVTVTKAASSGKAF